MAVVAYVLAQPTQREIVPRSERASVRAAGAWLTRMKETWRSALHDGEVAFVFVILDAEGLPLKSWEHPREGWGADGIETGRAELRAMKAQAAE